MTNANVYYLRDQDQLVISEFNTPYIYVFETDKQDRLIAVHIADYVGEFD